MITLRVADYCHRCPDFEADIVKKPSLCDEVVVNNDTLITCKNEFKCRSIKAFIVKESEKANA